MDYATLITLISVALFLTGTPVLLVISGWVIATSYFVVIPADQCWFNR